MTLIMKLNINQSYLFIIEHELYQNDLIQTQSYYNEV